MSCAYLYVHNFPRTHVSRFRLENLAFDKETVVDGRGLTAKGAKDAKGESGDDKRRKAKPPQGRRARRNWGGRNLAFDKETVVDGRGLTAKGAKDAKGGKGDDKRRKAKPPQGRRARRIGAGGISHLTKKQCWTVGV